MENQTHWAGMERKESNHIYSDDIMLMRLDDIFLSKSRKWRISHDISISKQRKSLSSSLDNVQRQHKYTVTISAMSWHIHVAKGSAHIYYKMNKKLNLWVEKKVCVCVMFSNSKSSNPPRVPWQLLPSGHLSHLTIYMGAIVSVMDDGREMAMILCSWDETYFICVSIHS